jgi:hypothetical protein
VIGLVVLRVVSLLFLVLTLVLGVFAELGRAAADVVDGSPVACCPCDDESDGHDARGCCADDLGACGCSGASIAVVSLEPGPPAILAPPVLAAHHPANPAAWACRPAAPPPTPPPIG